MDISERLTLTDTAYGTLDIRMAYKMIDFNAFYRYAIVSNNHFIKAGVGASYCWGTNIRVEQRMYPIIIGYHGTYRVYSEKAHYWGLVSQLSYDYVFLKNIVNVGIDLRGRYYFGIPRGQYDYGFHVGINF